MASEVFYELYRKLRTVKKDESPGCVSVLDELAQACRSRDSNSSSPREWLEDVNDCLHEVAQSATLFSVAVASWLVRDEDIELARALIEEANVQHLRSITAKSYDLSSIDEARAILVGCRLCALSATPALSLGWAVSLTVSYPTSNKASQAAGLLLRYHVEEFPRTTQELLASEGSPFKSVALARETLASLIEWEAWWKGMPRLREFAMNPEMRLTLSNLKRSERRSIHRRSMENSIFAQLVTSQHFKYANKTAVEMILGDQIHERTLEMSSYSLSVEMPISERTDPQTGWLRRRRFWNGVIE